MKIRDFVNFGEDQQSNNMKAETGRAPKKKELKEAYAKEKASIIRKTYGAKSANKFKKARAK